MRIPTKTRPEIVPDSPPTIARFRFTGMDSAMPPIVALLVGSALRTAWLVENNAALVLGSDKLVMVKDGTTHVVGDLVVEFAGSEEFPEVGKVESRCDLDVEDVVSDGAVATVIHCVVVGTYIVT